MWLEGPTALGWHRWRECEQKYAYGLVERFKQAQERLRLYTELSAKQLEKYQYERARRTEGRTTTQQVLLFESDYEAAELSRIQALFDLFSNYTQMQLFEEAHHESR